MFLIPRPILSCGLNQLVRGVPFLLLQSYFGSVYLAFGIGWHYVLLGVLEFVSPLLMCMAGLDTLFLLPVRDGVCL